MAPHNKGKGAALAWLTAHASYPGSDCIIWPYCRIRGYGVVSIGGTIFKAHRVMCELANGLAPTPEHEAAHSCGNGHEGCINPNHLSWKTRSENQKDRGLHGTSAPLKGTSCYKLTEAKVAEIRAKQGIVSVTDLAARFGVTRSTIRQIHLRKIWVTGKRAKGGFAPGDPRNPSIRRRAMHADT